MKNGDFRAYNLKLQRRSAKSNRYQTKNRASF
jgi:hypothetical protein